MSKFEVDIKIKCDDILLLESILHELELRKDIDADIGVVHGDE